MKNESFTATDSDAFLVGPLVVGAKTKSTKPSLKTSEVSNHTTQESFDKKKNFSRYVPTTSIETAFVSSLHTSSQNADYARLCDTPMFVNIKDDPEESNTGPSCKINPNLILNLEDDTTLKETPDEEPSSSVASFSKISPMVNSETQTESSMLDNGSVDIGIQCNLLENLFISEQLRNKTFASFQRITAVNLDSKGDVTNTSHRRDLEKVTLKHSASESYLQSVHGKTGFAHKRSLSDEVKYVSKEELPHVKVNKRKLCQSHSADGPGMRALQTLSQSLEASIHLNSLHESKVKELTTSPLSRRRVSLRKVALLMKSPKKKFNKEKRNKLYVDSVSEIERMEKELNATQHLSDDNSKTKGGEFH